VADSAAAMPGMLRQHPVYASGREADGARSHIAATQVSS
jgi:hypothetical protein